MRWRLWNGKAKNAGTSIDRIRTVMRHFRGERGGRKPIASSRKLWTALYGLDGYLTGQSDWMVNYAERYRAGLPVGTAITEGTANFQVNRRMNKSATDAVVATRCRFPAVYNGTLGSGVGQKFQPPTIHPCQRRSPLDPQSCGGPSSTAEAVRRPRPDVR